MPTPDDSQEIEAQASADERRVRAWMQFVLAVVALGGAIAGVTTLTILGRMPVEIASNVFTACAMAVLFIIRGGTK